MISLSALAPLSKDSGSNPEDVPLEPSSEEEGVGGAEAGDDGDGEEKGEKRKGLSAYACSENAAKEAAAAPVIAKK